MKNVNECTECGWQGTDEQKVDIMQPDGMGLLTCPSCGGGEFYVEPLVKNCTIPDVIKSVCEPHDFQPVFVDEYGYFQCTKCKAVL